MRKLSKKEVKELCHYLRKWTEAEIKSKHVSFSHSLSFTEYVRRERLYRDKIRVLVFGESHLLTLGEDWGILTTRIPVRRTKKVNGEEFKWTR